MSNNTSRLVIDRKRELMEKVVMFFLQGLPETIGVVALSLAVERVPLKWKYIVPISLVLSFFIFVIRSLPVSLGIHTVAAILLLAFFMVKFTRVPSTKCFIAIFISISFLTALEFIFHEPIFWFLDLSLNQILSNDTIWMLVGLPQATVMIISALFVARIRKPDFDAWRIRF